MSDPVCDALGDARLTLAGLFFETHAGLSAVLGERLETESGLSNSEFEVLLRLGRSDQHRLRMTDLAAQVSLSSSGLTRAVDRLVTAGLVTRESCPSDRRGSFAVLTATGVKRIKRAAEIHLEHLDEVFTGLLDASQQAALEDALRIVRDAVNPGAISGTRAQPRS